MKARKSKPTDAGPAKLFLVRPRPTDPPPELVEKALKLSADQELSQFASDLSEARMFWRKHRTLVEAPGFPELLRKHFVKMWDYEPDGEFPDPDFDVLACVEAGAITPAVREQLLPEAREIALKWLAMEQAASNPETKAAPGRKTRKRTTSHRMVLSTPL